jgi:hypothetical protein
MCSTMSPLFFSFLIKVWYRFFREFSVLVFLRSFEISDHFLPLRRISLSSFNSSVRIHGPLKYDKSWMKKLWYLRIQLVNPPFSTLLALPDYCSFAPKSNFFRNIAPFVMFSLPLIFTFIFQLLTCTNIWI